MNALRLVLEPHDITQTARCPECRQLLVVGLRDVLVLRAGDEIVAAVCDDCAQTFEVTR